METTKSEGQMSKGGSRKNEEINYGKVVIDKSLEEYWRADEKVALVLLGFSNQVPIATLCELNNISPRFITSGGRLSLLVEKKACQSGSRAW